MMERFIILVLVIHGSMGSDKKWSDKEETTEYWNKLAQDELDVAIEQQQLNHNKAKNVIVFIGDGMDGTTITSARILKGQNMGESGENTKLHMDTLSHAAFSKTYSVDRQVPDSAATATAILSGVKTKDYVIGLNGKVTMNDCASEPGNEVNSTLIEAWEAGKSIGIVTTTRIMHATPAAAYAHTSNRGWYSDSSLTKEAIKHGCKDISQQLMDRSHMFTVIMGGGRSNMRPNTSKDEEYINVIGHRLDGQDLIDMWEKGGPNRKYVRNNTQFHNIDIENTDKLLGIFEPEDMQYEADRSSGPEGEPSIAEMVETAIKMLQKNKNGFYLLVEGGRIDHAHHDGNAHRALVDTIAFDDSVGKAKTMTSEEDTMIIVTADHGHTISLGGYAHRGNPIFGLTQDEPSYVTFPSDKKRYTSLLYSNGPGFQGMSTQDALGDAANPANVSFTREDLTDVDTESIDYLQQTAVPMFWETHGGADVAILASGPMAHLFHGVHEQSYIAHVIRYGSCLGKYTTECNGNREINQVQFLGRYLDKSSTELALYIQFGILILLVLLLIVIICHVTMARKKQSPVNV